MTEQKITHKAPHCDSLGYFLLKVRKDEWRVISQGKVDEL